MASHGWLVIPALVTLSAAAFAACSSVSTTPTTSSSSGASSGAGGSGGAGGAPGVTAAVASSSTGEAEDAGPLTCKSHTYSTIKTGPCDLLAQDCAEGQTCKEVKEGSAWTTHCVTANGLKGEGEKCAVDDECLAKLTCAAGRCSPVCCKATNAPCLGGICNLFIQFDDGMTANKQVCHYAKACALLTEEACEPGFRCHVEDSVQGLATCVQPSSAHPGDLGSCSFLNDCLDMEHCHNGTPAKPGLCHYYCYLDQANPSSPGAGLGGCPTGQTCQTKVDGVKVDLGIPEIGLCAPNP